MALYDNRHWLLSHIKNSFISSDDTGMCEAVIIDDIPKDSDLFGEHDKFPNIEDSSDDDDGYNNSLDIFTDADCGAHRYRTNTAQRLAKMEQEMKKAAQIKHVKWENPSSTRDETINYFEKKESKETKQPLKSLLSLQLEDCPSLPRNPFVEYAKFGSNAHMGMPTRTYKVFLTMLPLPERNYPCYVCVLSTTKIFELIGYICWKYTSDFSDATYQFKENIKHYALYIAEDDGEVDWDFSCLDRNESVGKFGLAYLALVELSPKDISSEAKPKEMMPVQVRKPTRSPEPVLDGDDLKQIEGDLTAIEALLYQSFNVQIVSKMRTKTDVVLGINGDKMEIDPVVSNTKVSSKMWRLKSASYDMDDIVFCEVTETRSSGRAAFRIVRRTPAVEDPGTVPLTSATFSPVTSSFKNLDFEADVKVAEEVVRKINLILHLKCSIHRREYLTLREKKPTRRRSFSIWK